MKSARVFDLLKLKINYFLSFIGYKFEKISSSEFEFFRISKRCEKAISDFIQSRDTLDLDKINKLKLKVLHLLNEMVLNALREFYPDLVYGNYIHFADSFHIYEKHFEMLKKIVNGNKFNKIEVPKLHLTNPVFENWLLQSY